MAIVKLVPLQSRRAVALVGFDTLGHAIEGSHLARRASADIEAVELMTSSGIELVARVKDLTPPMRTASAYLLIELAGRDAFADLVEVVAALPHVVDTAIAEGSSGQRLWVWREAHTESISTLGPPLKLDVTLPIQTLAEFIESVPAIVRGIDGQGQPWFFGHAADGNVHINVTGLADSRDTVTDSVLRRVASLGGSISTEHGIGTVKRRWLPLVRDAAEVGAMRAVKHALDPDGILNPHVLL